MILVPISLGELIDKITILKIKLIKIDDPVKLVNISKEYYYLYKILLENNFSENHEYFKKLYSVNLQFWEYHDWQRLRWKSYHSNIIDIELYRRTRDEHVLNDLRAFIKKEININFNSEIIEEKYFTQSSQSQ
jgi:hypothetical protein